MENENKKVLTLSFLIAGVLVAFVTGLLLDTFAATWGVVARVLANDLVRHGISVGLGFATFVALQFNRKVLQYGDEVVTELRKIVWPSRRDTVAMTVVVCVMVLLSGVMFWVFDVTFAYAMQRFLEVLRF